jgi:hypothetical protein
MLQPGGAWPSLVPAGTVGPSVVITGAVLGASNKIASQAFERFEVPANPSELRARKAHRRGGYAPRPPPATRTAPASVDVDLTESGYELLCELCYGTAGGICLSADTSAMKLACLLILVP